MNNKTKTILGIVIFVLFIAGAAFAYNELSKYYKPEVPLVTPDIPTATTQAPPKPTKTPADDDVQEDDVQKDDVQEDEAIKAPDFSAFDSEGNAVKLSDYFGKPLVLNFWASWCPPCKSEMPHFNKIYNELKEDVVFLMVDMVDGSQETETRGKKYIADNGFTFPVLYDTLQDAAYTYGIRSLPTTVFVDKDGNVAAGVEGAIDEETLLKGIELITNTEKEPEKPEADKEQ